MLYFYHIINQTCYSLEPNDTCYLVLYWPLSRVFASLDRSPRPILGRRVEEIR